MLAAAVLASWVAQAEPAPAPPPAAPVVARPAPPAPTDNTVAVYAGVAHRVGPEANTIAPKTDIAIGGSYQWRYWSSPAGFELGVGLDFFYDQFRKGSDPTIVSQSSFAATPTAAWRWRRLRPFALAGAGVSIGYAATSPTVAPGQPAAVSPSTTAALPLLRGGVGLEVTIVQNISVVVRGSYTLILTRPELVVPATTTGDAVTYTPLGNFLDASAGVAFQF
jgi:hypothetical protein